MRGHTADLLWPQNALDPRRSWKESGTYHIPSPGKRKETDLRCTLYLVQINQCPLKKMLTFPVEFLR